MRTAILGVLAAHLLVSPACGDKHAYNGKKKQLATSIEQVKAAVDTATFAKLSEYELQQRQTGEVTDAPAEPIALDPPLAIGKPFDRSRDDKINAIVIPRELMALLGKPKPHQNGHEFYFPGATCLWDVSRYLA